jgi:phosphoglycerate dehydrogenase-like enzyme
MIILLETVHDDARRILEAADDVVLMRDPSGIDAEIDRADVRAVVTRGRGRIDADLLRSLPRAAVVGRCGAGLDNIDVPAAAEQGVAVVHAPGSTTAAVAEHAVMLMLALARRLTDLVEAVRADRWEHRDGYLGTELRGKRLGIIGLGAIGTRIAEVGRCLDMEVVCTTSRTDDVAIPRLSLEELLITSDVVQVCTALTPHSTALLGPAEFTLMQPEALLVNTARGAIVDHDALAAALEEGQLAGYAADVWRVEPPAQTRPLTDPRVLVTPHVAALTDTTYREICVRTAAAVSAVLGGIDPDPRTVHLPPPPR